MDIREFNKIDYYLICEWWTAHKWNAPSYLMLPKTGFIIEGLCAGFLYKTDSEIAWLEFVISNPKSDKELRNEALNILIEKLINEAKQSGFKVIFTSVEHTKLIDRYKNHGFVETDKSMTNMIKRL
jgi:hypothetical protein